MKKKRFFYAFLAACAVCTGLCVSCEKDNQGGEEPAPEPPATETPEVSLRLADGSEDSFSLTHGVDGTVSGTVEFSFTANLSSVSEEDVTVSFDASCDGISAGKISLSKKEVTIPAGDSSSENVTVTVTDWSELASVTEAGEYVLTVKIASASVETGSNSSIEVTVSKPAYSESVFPDFGDDFLNISSEQLLTDAGYVVNTDYTSWTFNFWSTNGATLENPVDNTVTGTGGSDVAVDNDMINFTVDFNETKTIGGLYFQHWGASYCPTVIRLSVSSDGESWVEMGTLDKSSVTSVYVGFREPLVTRYLKYEMLEISGTRVDIMKMNVYQK